MRTKEQIENLRGVLRMIIGPYALFLSSEDIDNWANGFQEELDRRNLGKWVLRIKTYSELSSGIDWKDILPEPNNHVCSLATIKYKCKALLGKYPLIAAIQLTDITAKD